MQMMLLEQQNKKRLLMLRDSPTGQSDHNQYLLTPGERDHSDYPPVPGELNRNGQAQARNGPLPNPRLVSATTEDEKLDDLVFRPPEVKLRRIQDSQKRPFQQSNQIYHVAQQTTPKDAGFDFSRFGSTPKEMPGRPSRYKRRTGSPPPQPYSRALPSDARTGKLHLVHKIDQYLERHLTRPRNREISSRLRPHDLEELLWVGMSRDRM
jgi:hypothetical protein